MNRLEGIPFFNFSPQNKYTSDYNVSYKRAVEAQNELTEAKYSSHAKPAEIEKWENDLKRWENKVENYSALAKAEEKTIEQQQKGLGMNIDFMA